MMCSRFVLACFFLLNSPNVFSNEIFKISPYTLKHTSGQLILNFQLNDDRILKVDEKNEIDKAVLYKKDQHYQIELDPAACGDTQEVKILDTLTNKMLYAQSFPTPNCPTLKEDREFTFGFISDTQEYKERHESIAKIINYHHQLDPLQFLINGGDVVQNGHVEDEWINYFSGGRDYLTNIPQIAAIGNHDYRGHKGEELPFYFKKYMRWEGAQKNGNLFFEFPEFHLVIWNSNGSDLSLNEEINMWKWLELKLAKAKESNIPVILATHFPVYSSSLNRFSSLSVMKLRNFLVPLAERYGVKLILSGHTHMFERSFKDGVNYIVAGPAGGRVNKPSFKNPYKQSFDANALTFTKIKYQKRSLRIETFNQDNALIDQILINL